MQTAHLLPTFRFLDLPRELRDQVYALLLRDEPLISETSYPDERTQGCETNNLSIRSCPVPSLLYANKQISHEYGQVAFEKMHLTFKVVLDNVKRPFRLPSLLSNASWPPGVSRQLRSASIQISFGGPEFPQIQGIERLIFDFPALRTLNVELFFMVELIEATCHPDFSLPSVHNLLPQLPKPSGPLESIQTHLRVISQLFCQNPRHLWTNSKEARIIGDMWLHRDNTAIFRASPSNGCYHWRGLELEYQGSNISWDRLWEDCTSKPHQSESPYIT